MTMAETMGSSAARFVDLRSEITTSVRRVVGTGTSVAFLNFPDIANVGDPLLWLGARSVLDDLGTNVVYQARPKNFDPRVLAASQDIDMVILNGGGNFGDVWVGQHQIRQEVFDRFRDRPILQLPQTLWYENASNLARDAEAISAVENLVLMWREKHSYEMAERYFDATNVLVPDTAMAHPPLTTESPEMGITWLIRADRESIVDPGDDPDYQSLDPVWVADSETTAARIDELRTALDEAHKNPLAHSETIDEIHRNLAMIRIERGIAVLSGGSVTITDRLHGVILSAAMGIPAVAHDNRSHKVHGVIDTHLRGISTVTTATSLAEARSIAQEILETHV